MIDKITCMISLKMLMIRNLDDNVLKLDYNVFITKYEINPPNNTICILHINQLVQICV